MIVKNFNYEPKFNGVFSKDSLSRIKDGAYVINCDDKKVRRHIGFHYLPTEIRFCTLILLELNIFRKKYYRKSKGNPPFATYLEYKLMILLCGIFIVSLS